jgi:SprT-like family
MARAAVAESSGDELPDLNALLSFPVAKGQREESRRRSPRKQSSQAQQQSDKGHRWSASARVPRTHETPTTSFSAEQRQKSLKESSVKVATTGRTARTKVVDRPSQAKPKSKSTTYQLQGGDTKSPPRSILGEIPLLPRRRNPEFDLTTENHVSVSASSDNRLSTNYRQSSNVVGVGAHGLKLSHVDSLLLPLSKMAVTSEADESMDKSAVIQGKELSLRGTKTKVGFGRASRFILKEAQCNDDSQDSGREDDEEEEDTDLSGFVVDDAAELSFYDSSDASSDSDISQSQSRRPKFGSTSPRKRLQRGPPVQRAQLNKKEDSDAGEGSNKENNMARADEDYLENAMQDMQVGRNKVSGASKTKNSFKEIEVIDRSSAPEQPKLSLSLDPELKSKPTSSSKTFKKKSSTETGSSSTFCDDDFNAILRFSSSPVFSPMKGALKMELKTDLPSNSNIPMVAAQVASSEGNGQAESNPITNVIPKPSKDEAIFTTPPATPPHTPTKFKPSIKSPLKLLSPSKKAVIPDSPHRQSTDAFWDLEVVNTWNDTYSPKKAPLASPKKALGRFKIWEDSDEDSSGDNFVENGLTHSLGDSSSFPSPCSSPPKSKPSRSPIKAKPKNPEKEARRLFNANKDGLAHNLLADLDANVTSNKIRDLAASAGGVKIVWSKTLRSTAGRATWKRTITKPVKASGTVNGKGGEGEVKVSHYASIELAEKIVDCEERLVNTLAHEFCHLANFMVSGVRDQPHGREFKGWAAKVTAYLHQSGKDNGDAVRRRAEVTTKHTYVIDFKYVWVCVGRERSKVQEYLGIGGDEGCGGEYGRHSRSIDVEKQRCGRCKGILVQVKPKPRGGSPVKKGKEIAGMKKWSELSDGSLGGLATELDIVELSD